MMSVPTSFKDLWVWQRAVALVLDVYNTTDPLLHEHPTGVVRRMRRAATAIPAKIARGVGIGRPRSYIRCLFTAYGWSLELETVLHMARDLQIIPGDAAARLLLTNDEIAQILLSMASSPDLLCESGS